MACDRNYYDVLNLQSNLDVTNAIAQALLMAPESLVGKRFYFNAASGALYLVSRAGLRYVCDWNASNSDVPAGDADTIMIPKGTTFESSFGWLSPEKVYRQIAAATQAAPCVINVPAHGLPNDEIPITIQGAKGMYALNRTPELYRIVDPDHLEINDLNSVGMPAYTGGGVIVYQKPIPPGSATAQIVIYKLKGDADPYLTIDLTTNVDEGTFDLEITDEQTVDVIDNGFYKLLIHDGQATELLKSGTYIVFDPALDG